MQFPLTAPWFCWLPCVPPPACASETCSHATGRCWLGWHPAEAGKLGSADCCSDRPPPADGPPPPPLPAHSTGASHLRRTGGQRKNFKKTKVQVRVRNKQVNHYISLFSCLIKLHSGLTLCVFLLFSLPWVDNHPSIEALQETWRLLTLQDLNLVEQKYKTSQALTCLHTAKCHKKTQRN